MATTKGTSKAKAAKTASVDTVQTSENGASAPVSLATDAVGDVGTDGANQQPGGGDEGDARVASTDIDSGAVAGSGDAADQSAGALPGPGDASAHDAAENPGSPDAIAGDAGDSAGGPVDSGSGADLPGGTDSSSIGQVDDDVGKAVTAIGGALRSSGVGDALLALLQQGETVQTPSEQAPDAAVTSSVWRMPQIERFPAQITIKNNTPSRVAVLGLRLEPYTESAGMVNEAAYDRLANYLAKHARLGGWDHSTGVQVTHDSEY